MPYICADPSYEIREFSENNPSFAFLEVVNKETGYTFTIAKDSAGTQICHNGNFFPYFRDFGSLENALDFLNTEDNMKRAENFFKNSTGTPFPYALMPFPYTTENLMEEDNEN